MSKKAIPGHGNVEHASFSSDRPKQYKPAFSGGGLSQGLYRINSPPPHVVVHDDQSPHVPHFPFTATNMIYLVNYNIYIYIYTSVETTDIVCEAVLRDYHL